MFCITELFLLSRYQKINTIVMNVAYAGLEFSYSFNANCYVLASITALYRLYFDGQCFMIITGLEAKRTFSTVTNVVSFSLNITY